MKGIMSIEEKQRVVVLFGSQTGCAEETSNRIAFQARGSHFRCIVSPLDEYEMQNLVNEEIIIFVCATTGQGEAPDNMKRFWRFIMRKNLPPSCLSGVKFAVLGLGDSSYAKFNFIAKKLHRRIEMLGGDPIIDVGLADDQHDWGPDAVIDKWMTVLWRTLTSMFPDSHSNLVLPGNQFPPPAYRVTYDSPKIEVKEEINESHEVYGQKNPFKAKLKRNQRVTSENHFQDTRLIAFDISPAQNQLEYEAGDVVMIQPKNLPQNVQQFLDILPFCQDVLMTFEPIDCDVTLNIPKQITLWNLATEYLDFMSVPRRSFFQMLSYLSPDKNEREKLKEFGSPEGTEERYSYANRPRRNILEVLQDFHHTAAAIPINRILDVFPLIRPRAFSIASSPTRHKGELQILVAVVKYKTRLHKPRNGLCSTWLSWLREGETAKMWLRKGGIRFPWKQPCVMIGPGTGISPFRCAAHERHHAGVKGDVVFFGCRNRSGDFYFQDEWESMKVRLHAAFSRDQEEKCYVQHKITEFGADLFQLIDEGNACIFVAGNSKNMPDQVRDAIVEVVRCHGNMTSQEATDYVTKLQQSKRYQQETWS